MKEPEFYICPRRARPGAAVHFGAFPGGSSFARLPDADVLKFAIHRIAPLTRAALAECMRRGWVRSDLPPQPARGWRGSAAGDVHGAPHRREGRHRWRVVPVLS